MLATTDGTPCLVTHATLPDLLTLKVVYIVMYATNPNSIFLHRR